MYFCDLCENISTNKLKPTLICPCPAESHLTNPLIQRSILHTLVFIWLVNICKKDILLLVLVTISSHQSHPSNRKRKLRSCFQKVVSKKSDANNLFVARVLCSQAKMPSHTRVTTKNVHPKKIIKCVT